MKRTARVWIGLVILVLGAAIETLAANPADCLQFPIYDDGTYCLWLADHYPDVIPNTACNPGDAQEVFVWTDTGLPGPEDCPACIPRALLIPPALKASEKESDKVDPQKIIGLRTIECRRLPAPMEVNFSIKSSMPLSVNQTGHSPWKPRDICRVSDDKWVYVEPEGGGANIPVHLFVIDIDLGGPGGPHNGGMSRKPKRQTLLGFEVRKIPDSVPEQDVHVLTPEKLKPNSPCKYEGKVSHDNYVNPFRIITRRPLFR